VDEPPDEDEVEGTGLRPGLVVLGMAVVLLGLRLAVSPDASSAAGAGAVLVIVAGAGALLVAAARHPRRHALFGLAWAATLIALLSSISLVCGATVD
jgi:hypothetical protein